MEGRDRANPLDLVGMAARLEHPLAEQCERGAVAEQQQALRLDQADVAAGDLGAGFAVLARSSARRARGNRRATRCRRRRRDIPIAASMRWVRSQASPPIGCPAAASSSVGRSLSSITAAFSGPCGGIRRAARRRAAGWRCLRATIWSSARVSGSGSATFGAGVGCRGSRRAPGAASASRAPLPGRRRRRRPRATRPMRCAPRQCRFDPSSPPTGLSSPPLTPWSRNGQCRRVELWFGRDERSE